MSEYYTTDTPLDNTKCLRQALEDLGVPFEEHVEPTVHWHGRAPGPCDFVIRRASLGGHAYNDLAWRWNPATRRFDLVVDNLDHQYNEQVQGLIRRATQLHNAHKAIMTARRLGYAVRGPVNRMASGHLQIHLSR
jgi:hypothetical protein